MTKFEEEIVRRVNKAVKDRAAQAKRDRAEGATMLGILLDKINTAIKENYDRHQVVELLNHYYILWR